MGVDLMGVDLVGGHKIISIDIHAKWNCYAIGISTSHTPPDCGSSIGYPYDTHRGSKASSFKELFH